MTPLNLRRLRDRKLSSRKRATQLACEGHTVHVRSFICRHTLKSRWNLTEHEHPPDAKKRTGLAISSAIPKRFIGFNCPTLPSVLRCRAKSKVGSVMPVSIRPGRMALTRMLVPVSCQAQVWAMLITADLLALLYPMSFRKCEYG